MCSVNLHLPSTTLTSKATLSRESHGLIDRHMRQDQTHVLLPDEAVLVEIVDVKGKLDLGLDVRIVDLEEAVHELLQINVAITVEVEDREEPLTYDAGQL